mmetsp:Transcript_53234/g.147574  ORF Transcript_53234/g.147574 Transcript_53234/m.147574 type:complete len:96 (+) Transcript_53234:394-681(+)
MLKYMEEKGVIDMIRSPPKYPRLVESEEITLMIGRAVIQTEARREQLLKVSHSGDHASIRSLEVDVADVREAPKSSKNRSRSPKRGGRGKSGGPS